MTFKVWGVPLYSSTELLKKFKGSTLWPDVSGDTVIVIGADTMVFARNEKLLSAKKLYLCVDVPIVLKGACIPLNGAVYQNFRHMRVPLKKTEPEPWTPNPTLNAVQVLERNAKRVTGLVKAKGGDKGLKSMSPWHEALNKIKGSEATKRKTKGGKAGTEVDADEVKVIERDE
jgi:hypothetical protein